MVASCLWYRAACLCPARLRQKTHLAIALGVEAVRAGRGVYFCTLAELITSLAKTEARRQLARGRPPKYQPAQPPVA